MGPGATAEQLDAVVQTVQQAGGSAFVSRGVHRTIVGLVGDVEQFESLNLRAYPGVAEVVRISFKRKGPQPQQNIPGIAGSDRT